MKVSKVPENYTIVPNTIMRTTSLTAQSKWVACVLISLKHGKSNRAYPSMRTLVKECGLSVNSVQRALNQLTQCNIISVSKSTNTKLDTKFKASNIYTFRPSNEWLLTYEYMPSNRF